VTAGPRRCLTLAAPGAIESNNRAVKSKHKTDVRFAIGFMALADVALLIACLLTAITLRDAVHACYKLRP